VIDVLSSVVAYNIPIFMFIYVCIEDKKPSKNQEKTSYAIIILFSIGVAVVLLLGYIKLIKECLRPSVFGFEKNHKL